MSMVLKHIAILALLVTGMVAFIAFIGEESDPTAQIPLRYWLAGKLTAGAVLALCVWGGRRLWLDVHKRGE